MNPIPGRTWTRSTLAAITASVVLAGAAGAQSPAPSTSAVSTSGVLTCPASATGGSPAASTDAQFDSVPLKPAPKDKPVGTWAGTWTAMPAAPIAARAGAATDFAPFGGAMVVWSGYGGDGSLLWDGAVFDPGSATWTTIEPSPLAPRTSFAFEIGGRGSMLIRGGVAPDGTPLSDGAVWQGPSDRQVPTAAWVPGGASPTTPGPAFGSGDVRNWTYLVVSGTDASAPPTVGYSSGTAQAWTDLDQPPTPLGVGYEIVTPTLDDPRFISFQADGQAIVSRWDELKGWTTPLVAPLPATSGCPAIDQPWIGWVGTDATGSPVGLLAPAGAKGSWRRTATPPTDAVTDGMLLWAPGHLVVADALLAYATGSDRWLRLPALPDGPRVGVSAAWADGRLYVWGGRTADGAVTDTGWVFTPDLPAGTLRLPGGYRPRYGDCGGEPVSGGAVLHADRKDRALVWFETAKGRRYTTSWPDGYIVRFGARGAVVLDPDGAVIAREGDQLRDLKLFYCPSNGNIFFE